MKKVTIILIFASLIFNSCGNTNSSTKEKEIELRESELKQKEEILLSEKKIDLVKKGAKFSEKEFKTLKELEQSGGSGSIEKILITGKRNSNVFKKVKREVAASLELFETKVDSEFIGFANETLEDLVKLKKCIESQRLPDVDKKELTDDIDNAISKISKNVQEAGGTPFGKKK